MSIVDNHSRLAIALVANHSHTESLLQGQFLPLGGDLDRQTEHGSRLVVCSKHERCEVVKADVTRNSPLILSLVGLNLAS